MSVRSKTYAASAIFMLFFILPAFPIYGEDGLARLKAQTRSMADISSLNGTIVEGQPQGVFDKSTGSIFILQQKRPIVYTRTGCAIIVDTRGTLVTNAHTVRDAGGIVVTLFDGTKAAVLSTLIVPDSDIAFLKIEPPFPLQPMTFADSDSLPSNLDVFTIGHSETLKGTMLQGKLVSTGRGMVDGAPHVTDLKVAFQQPLYKGDSGSPVMDISGKFLGMIAAGESTHSITFAIPSYLIAAAYRDHIKNREAK